MAIRIRIGRLRPLKIIFVVVLRFVGVLLSRKCIRVYVRMCSSVYREVCLYCCCFFAIFLNLVYSESKNTNKIARDIVNNITKYISVDEFQ